MKLEAICAAAGLTRGSFYHHFKDHGTFLTDLARHWLTRQTTDIADRVADHPVSPEKAEALTEAAMTIDYRLELGMRELGRRVPEVGGIVREADETRLKVVADIYAARFGIDAGTAARFAMLEYAVFNGVILIDPDYPPEEQRSLAALFGRMASDFLEKTPSE